ncbi:MAG: RnfABCDGE type electron transport complex subunit D [Clostridia bacterium]|nr:RnfABCDGE type electron transport complex subunit D [Clostridia bacterium]
MIKSNIKASPFIHGSENALNLHLDLLIGLLSVMIISVVQNGLRALTLCLFSALTAWLTEKIGLIIVGREKSTDLRSLAMGLIIAMLCPVTVPLWLPISASFISVLFVRVILGPNFKNLFLTPVIAWIFMLTVAPEEMTSYAVDVSFGTFSPFENINNDFYVTADSIAQQLQLKKELSYSFLDILTGNYPGGLGTTCIFIILGVCVYFIFRRSMAWQVSLSMIITVAIFALLINRTTQSPLFSVLYELSATSYIFVAVFVAGDIINAPSVTGAKIVYGVLIGVLTMAFRYLGFAEHCVLLSLFICNFFCELLDVLFLYLQIYYLRKRMIKR